MLGSKAKHSMDKGFLPGLFVTSRSMIGYGESKKKRLSYTN